MSKKRLAGPTYLGASVANLYNLNDALIKSLVRQIHVVNTDTGTQTFTMYIGATGGSAGGTEIFKDESLTAKQTKDYFFQDMPLLSTDFLTAIASIASKIVVTVIGTTETI